MKKRSQNPKKQVPKVVAEISSAVQPTVLPTRRTASDVSDTAAEANRIGLRIESHVERHESPQSPQRIEVQELTGSVVRLEQSASSPQKVARLVKFLELPAREEGSVSASEEGAQWGQEKQRSTSWMVGAGIGLAVILILCILLLPLINSSHRKRTKVANPQTAIAMPDKTPLKRVNPLEGNQTKALELFCSYLTATTVEEALAGLRDRETLAPILRERWQPTGIPKQWRPKAMCSWSVIPLESKSYAVMRGVLPDQSEFTAYFIHDGKEILLDWKATVAYSSAPFADLEKKRGDATEVRGRISLSEYYTSSWPEADYRSFKFTSGDRETTLWVYVRRGGNTAAMMIKFLTEADTGTEAQKNHRVTLRLAPGPETALPNQWLIQEILHPEWINP